jgi:integrase
MTWSFKTSRAGREIALPVRFRHLRSTPAIWRTGNSGSLSVEAASRAIKPSAPGSAPSSFYGYLSDYGLLLDEEGRAVANPMSAIESPRIEVGPPDWLKPEEDAKLLGCQMDDAERIIIFLLRMTGMRVGEARALRWSDVDFEDGTISVEKSKFGKSRIIPIVPELLPHLRHWAAVLEGKGLFARNGPVLSTRNGTPIVTQHIEKLVARVGIRAELQDRLHPHKLR